MYKIFSLVNMKGRDQSEELGADRKILLQWI
jgi:hypothetical protein